MLQKIAICIVVLGVFLCGCTAPLPEKTGSITITSSPSGAEVYLDNEYHGTTPGTIKDVAAGNHTVEVRENSSCNSPNLYTFCDKKSRPGDSC
jgi:hypothetical protein